MKKSTKIDAWVISDGTKGMENQSLALAKLLNINFELVKYNPPYFLKKFPLIRKLFISSVKDHLLKNKSPPSFIITTGKRMAGVSIALKFILKDRVKNIHIQNPKLPFEYFDLLLIPEHDNITAKNVIQTKGALTFFNFNELNKFQEREINLIKGSKKNLVLLMIGGNSKRYKPKNFDYYHLSMKVLEATKNLNCKLLVLLSRRTPLKAAKILNYSFIKHDENFQIVTSSEQNPYPEILQIADYIIVTSDSVNMVSETATLPIPLFVSKFSKETGKISNFLNNLEDLGILKKFEGQLFHYYKNTLKTNQETILKVNKLLGL